MFNQLKLKLYLEFNKIINKSINIYTNLKEFLDKTY